MEAQPGEFMKKILLFITVVATLPLQALSSMSLTITNNKDDNVTIKLKDSKEEPLTVAAHKTAMLSLPDAGLYNFMVDNEGHIFNIAFAIDKDKSNLRIGGPKGSVSACLESPKD